VIYITSSKLINGNKNVRNERLQTMKKLLRLLPLLLITSLLIGAASFALISIGAKLPPLPNDFVGIGIVLVIAGILATSFPLSTRPEE